MLNQVYIKSGNSYILCVLNNKNKEQNKGIVTLVPGFAESKSDIDYFMTRLANKLVDKGYITIQVDLLGHGDSYGMLEELSCSIVIRNLEDIYNYLVKNYNEIPKYLVSRGIYVNIFINTGIKNMFQVVGLNPVLNFLKKQDYCRENDVLEINDLLKEKKFQFLFEAMGSELGNIRGQRIDGQFLESIPDYRKIELGENVILTYDMNSPLEEQSKLGFVREFCWQESIMKKIMERIEKVY